MEILHSKYVLLLLTKQQITSSLSEKRYYVDVLRGGLNSTSAYVPAQLTKDKLHLHHIDTLTKKNVKDGMAGLQSKVFNRNGCFTDALQNKMCL